MKIYNCNNKCCKLKIEPYLYHTFYKYGKQPKKAGVFVHCIKNDKVLIIQSKGNLWGIPKGKMKEEESVEECAIRELWEETGLKLDKKLDRKIKVLNKATYYYIQIDEEINVFPQTHIKNNDANGIGWIKPMCLKNMIISSKIQINKHCKIVFKKFLNIDL